MEKIDIKNRSTLIIIVTRIGKTNEWKNWGFKKQKKFSYVEISEAVIKSYHESEFGMRSLFRGLSTADVCVFNGRYFRPLIKEELSEVDWENFERDVEVRVHGKDVYNTHVEGVVDGQRKQTIQNLLSGHNTYGLDGKPLDESKCPEALIGLAVRDGAQDALRKSVARLRGSEELAQDADEDGHDAASKFSTLKHRLSHLFIPLSVDLQGWRESGFSIEYAHEIAEEYEGRTEKILKKSTSVLGKIKETVKLVDQSRKKDIDCLLKNLENENSEPNCTLDLIHKIDKEKYRKELKNKLSDKRDFEEWFSELEGDLDDVRDEVFYNRSSEED